MTPPIGQTTNRITSPGDIHSTPNVRTRFAPAVTKFTYLDVSGFEVGSAYSAYLADETEPDWDRYREYNRDNILAVKHILDTVANASKHSITKTGN